MLTPEAAEATTFAAAATAPEAATLEAVPSDTGKEAAPEEGYDLALAYYLSSDYKVGR